MDLAVADKNFKVETKIDKDDVVWYEADKAPFEIYGAYTVAPYKRIPQEVAERVSDSVEFLNKNTSGIRAKFRTDSPYVAIKAEWKKQSRQSKMTVLASCGFDLYSRSEYDGRFKSAASYVLPLESPEGYESVKDVSGVMTDYILNFPLYNDVDKLYIGVKEGSGFEKPAPYFNELPVVFYGSSITQGGCASKPGNCYQNFLSRMLNMDYLNLGFSGSGKAEDVIVDYMKDLKMSVFVSDYDHNASTVEYLDDTHYKMYETIRKAQPDLPYVMISRPDYKWQETDDLRRSVIMESYQKALANGDKNVYFIDGASIFSGIEDDACTVDGAHPNDLGFFRMSQAIYPVLYRLLYHN